MVGKRLDRREILGMVDITFIFWLVEGWQGVKEFNGWEWAREVGLQLGG